MGRLTKRMQVKAKWNKRITKLIAKYMAVNNPGIREKVVFTMGKAMLIDLKNRLDDANMSVFTV